MLSYLFLGIIAAYLIGSVSALILNKKDYLCTYASFISACIASILGIVFSFSVLFGKNFEFTTSSDLPLTYGFFVDKLSAFFILVISMTAFAVSIYSIGYVREYYGKKNIGYLAFLYNIFLLSMILVVSANNVVMFLIVWELMSIISYLLVFSSMRKRMQEKQASYI